MKKPTELLLDTLDWKKIPDPAYDSQLPYATHEGILKIGDQELKVFRLNTGEAVIEAESFARFFDSL